MHSFTPLDSLLTNPLRLGMMAILMKLQEADFLYLKKHLNATSGNLSVQISKLEEAGYIYTTKGYDGKLSRTTCTITQKGARAFSEYFVALESYK